MALLDSFHRPAARATLTAPRLSLMQRLALLRSRRALARLDDAALDDIGVTRTAARTEARRPIWDVPTSWLR